jgi:hypothetical protein
VRSLTSTGPRKPTARRRLRQETGHSSSLLRTSLAAICNPVTLSHQVRRPPILHFLSRYFGSLLMIGQVNPSHHHPFGNPFLNVKRLSFYATDAPFPLISHSVTSLVPHLDTVFRFLSYAAAPPLHFNCLAPDAGAPAPFSCSPATCLIPCSRLS